jgi:hypothetical protein
MSKRAIAAPAAKLRFHAAEDHPTCNFFIRLGMTDSDAEDRVTFYLCQMLDRAHPGRSSWGRDEQPYLNSEQLRCELSGDFFSTLEKFEELLVKMESKGLLDILRGKYPGQTEDGIMYVRPGWGKTEPKEQRS